MLSFFSKKKQSPDSSPEEVIQGPTNPQQKNDADDYIFVEKKPEEPAQPQDRPLYPPMPLYPGASYPPPVAAKTAAPLPYVHGVPFQLAPELSSANTFELTQLQVDGILALMTRQMSVDEAQDYNFVLERSIQNESY